MASKFDFSRRNALGIVENISKKYVEEDSGAGNQKTISEENCKHITPTSSLEENAFISYLHDRQYISG